MEPRSHESAPTPVEHSLAPTNQSIEVDSSAYPEVDKSTTESRDEHAHQTTQTPQSNNVVQLPTPTPTPLQQDTSSNLNQDDSSHPVVASDDDLIEKEWVDKAKQIIAETKSDPYKREQAVSKLQADYLKKRYGKNLGTEAA